MATADGIVTFAGPLAAYGNVVFVDHGHGFSTFYGHCSSYRVREGQRVRRGEVLAYVAPPVERRAARPLRGHVSGIISNPMKYTVDTSGSRFAGDVETEKDSPPDRSQPPLPFIETPADFPRGVWFTRCGDMREV